LATERNLYEILGINRNATTEEIKKAYRRAAKKHHPDVNPGNKEAEERFKEATSAFEVLGDSKKRALYDEFGSDAVKIGFDEEKARTFRQWRAGQSNRASQGIPGFGHGEEFDLGDILGSLFGARRKERSGPTAPAASIGEDLTMEIEISLREAVMGAERSLTYQRPSRCDRCNGTGIQPGSHRGNRGRICPECSGSGQTHTKRGPIGFSGTCSYCGGTGKIADQCSKCKGSGLVSEPAGVTFKIPAGVAHGSKIRLAGQGGAGEHGGPPGDLYLVPIIAPHPFLRRENSDLHMDLPVTAGEAFNGAEVSIPTFHGRVTVTIPQNSQSGRELRLRGMGVPDLKGKARGDLYVELLVVLPSSSDSAKEIIKDLEGCYSGDVRADVNL
jgi:molecular chaperone DnaJ